MWKATMVGTKRSAGVAPELNLKNQLCEGNKACKLGIRPDFEIQSKRHQKYKTGISAAQQKVGNVNKGLRREEKKSAKI